MNNKLKKEIIEYIEKNQPEVYWDYRDSISKDDIEKILNSKDGFWEWQDSLYEMNLEYIFQLETDFADHVMSEFDLNMDTSDFMELFQEYICVNLNTDRLINNTPDLTVLIPVYSNYDCANSFTPFEPEEYTWEVWKRVKKGVLKKDFLSEFHNGAYGGSLFCFVFKTDLRNLIDLKQGFKESITIPKGTQFGFFSSFQGSGSIFEHRTTKNMTLPKVEPNMTEYDCLGIIADLQQSYSIMDVYGTDQFIDNQNVTVN